MNISSTSLHRIKCSWKPTMDLTVNNYTPFLYIAIDDTFSIYWPSKRPSRQFIAIIWQIGLGSNRKPGHNRSKCPFLSVIPANLLRPHLENQFSINSSIIWGLRFLVVWKMTFSIVLRNGRCTITRSNVKSFYTSRESIFCSEPIFIQPATVLRWKTTRYQSDQYCNLDKL